jgi:hypothetical protein
MASIAARANIPATYLAPVRMSRGMAASSHLPDALSGGRGRAGPMDSHAVAGGL